MNNNLAVNKDNNLSFILKKSIYLNFIINLLLLIICCMPIICTTYIYSDLVYFCLTFFFLIKCLYLKISEMSREKIDAYLCKVKYLVENKKSMCKLKYFFKVAIYAVRFLGLASFSNKNTLIKEFKPRKSRRILSKIIKYMFSINLFFFIKSVNKIFSCEDGLYYGSIRSSSKPIFDISIFMILFFIIVLLDLKTIIKLKYYTED